MLSDEDKDLVKDIYALSERKRRALARQAVIESAAAAEAAGIVPPKCKPKKQKKKNVSNTASRVASLYEC